MYAVVIFRYAGVTVPRQHPTPLVWVSNLAGRVGFEPTVHGVKFRCLTTWLPPKNWLRGEVTSWPLVPALLAAALQLSVPIPGLLIRCFTYPS